jgi:hypothetical protein
LRAFSPLARLFPYHADLSSGSLVRSTSHDAAARKRGVVSRRPVSNEVHVLPSMQEEAADKINEGLLTALKG